MLCALGSCNATLSYLAYYSRRCAVDSRAGNETRATLSRARLSGKEHADDTNCRCAPDPLADRHTPSIGLLQIASWLPERIHQIDVELGGAEDVPNGILPDMRCDPSRLVGDRVGCYRDDRPSCP